MHYKPMFCPITSHILILLRDILVSYASITNLLLVLVSYSTWLLFPLSMFIMSLLSYRSALSAAGAYGKAINAAVDINRFELLKSLHIPLKSNLKDEKEQNQYLSNFFVYGYPYSKITYKHDGEPSSSDSGSSGKVKSANQTKLDGVF